jgi:hypothetical protein
VRTPEPATTAPAAAVEAPAGDGPVPSADGAEGVPMPLLLGGGVALAVLGILLLRRK